RIWRETVRAEGSVLSVFGLEVSMHMMGSVLLNGPSCFCWTLWDYVLYGALKRIDAMPQTWLLATLR
ncbi:site-specific DNA-methyltransferase, partial [Sphingomonas yabuuchiae]|nr:site-specific DNA-methyltransferase [Sphingomonas yabuuchiae]